MLTQARLGLVLCIIAADLAGLVYLNALRNPFVYDDAVSIVTNPTLRESGNVAALLLQSRFRPLTNVSYAADHALWGLDPLGYHVTSVLLHVLSVALLFVLTFRAVEDWRARDPAAAARLSPPVAAFAAAALFAAHPLMTQAVGYASARAEVLCAALSLGALLALRAGLVAERAGGVALGVSLLALAVAAKEIAVMVPFVALAWDRLLLAPGEAARRRLRRVHAPLVAAVVLLGVARLAAFTWIETGTPGAPRHLLAQPEVIWRYAALLVAPLSQSLVHAVREPARPDAGMLAATAGLLLAAGTAVGVRRRQPLQALGIAWFLLLLAPSSAVALWEPMAEHRVYLASAGIFIAAGALLANVFARLEARGPAPRAAALVGFGALVAVLALATVARNHVWADPVGLWRDAAVKAPGEWRAHYGLANALAESGRCADAVPVFRRALWLSPQPYLWSNLGACLAAEGRPAEARAAYREALALDPRYALAHHNLGMLELRAGDREAAHLHFLQAITAQPRDARWRHDLVALYEAKVNDRAKTLELCREIARVAAPSDAITECIRRNER